MTEDMKTMMGLVCGAYEEVDSMSKADKMLSELGCKVLKIGSCVELGFESGNTVNLWGSPNTIDSDFTEMPIDVWLAIHEKMKELGWINEQSI